MNSAALWLLYFACFFTFALVVAIVMQWVSHSAKRGRRDSCEKILHSLLSGSLSERDGGKLRSRAASLPLLDAWVALCRTVTPDEDERSRAIDFFFSRGLDIHFIRQLRSRSVFRRCRAAFYLGFMKTERSQRALTLSLKQESHESVKVYLIGALCRQEASSSLPDIVDSIHGCSRAFILRITGLLLDFQSSFTALFPELETRREPELLELLVEFARLAPYKIFSGYLAELLSDPRTETGIRRKAFACLAESYPYAINLSDWLDHDDPSIREAAIDALGSRPGKANAGILISAALGGQSRVRAVASLSRMAEGSATVFFFLTELAGSTKDARVAKLVSQVLSCRLGYFLLKLGSAEGVLYGNVVSEVMDSGKLSELISFMNGNHDGEIENRLISIIQERLARDSSSSDELRMYLKDTILQKLGFSPLPLPQKRINEKRESVRRKPLAIILLGVLLVFPALFIASLLGGTLSMAGALREAANRYLAAFGCYALVLNAFYFFLAFLSYAEAGKQSRFYAIKDASFLFRKNLLPSISILAPAYNEEKSIVASVESLLNVNYPDFEVIVVNDGSKDGTLDTLIDRFKLEKTDLGYAETLLAQPVRGIYSSPRIPELKVIDKINGGKADSLNVGLNVASREYVLGIDSDSILERDALLSLVSAFLDEDAVVVASGGNIMPVNGCAVDRGVVMEKRIPTGPVPLLQTVEYLRSFMNGRMGWARLDSLLIISGAFGIFRRENVLAINGYLTSREKYEKDTVGEDMELVVRLTRSLREQAIPHKILYNYKANCWTEVPSSIPVLKRQRERWQRGLIDILSFHKAMIGNPRYGTCGVLAFPYYLLVEVVGPWVEFLGSVFFLAAILAGWIDAGVLVFLIASNFVFSFALSLFSLYICDRDGPQFPVRDRVLLMIVSLLETLGPRQLFSFFRITGYLGVLRKVTGWGAMTRQGFGGKKGGAK